MPDKASLFSDNNDPDIEIHITDWETRYEVNDKGHAARPGDELRVGGLEFVRLKVYGHVEGPGWKKLRKVAGRKAAEVFGIFCKFLEISGNSERGNRGVLRESADKRPATIKDLAFILSLPESQIRNAVFVLSNPVLGWLTLVSRNSGKFPEKHGAFLNTTQLNTTQYKKKESNKEKYLNSVFLTETEYQKLIEVYGLDVITEKITDLDLYIGKFGKKYKSHSCVIQSWCRKDKIPQLPAEKGSDGLTPRQRAEQQIQKEKDDKYAKRDSSSNS